MTAAPSTMPPTPDPRLRGRWIHPPGSPGVLEEIQAGDVPRDLRGAMLVGAELPGVDFSGCDLTGADLSRADLRGASFVGADLSAAILHEAKLDRAEFAGACLLGASLEHAEATYAGFGKADLRRASLFGATLENASFVDARLRHADLRDVRAKDARFSNADLTRADFARADLSGAELSGTQVRSASFIEADLRGGRLRSMRHFDRALFLRADVRDVDFSGAYMLRRHILDENYLAEFRNQSALHRGMYWAWWLSSDCGRSLLRWSGWTAVIAFGFAFAFSASDVSWGENETWLSPLYYSVVTLTSLGYGDVVPTGTASQLLAMAEVSLGYVMLGGLISIFANKLARRGE
ncbi:MAG: pentapeptide repeat-containing protein [Sandaracinaceae bacterium]